MPPPYVSPGQPITSAWGNDVVYSLGEIDGRLTSQIGAVNTSLTGQINGINSRLAGNIRGGITTLAGDTNGHYYVYFGYTFPSTPVVTATIHYDAVQHPRFISTVAVTQTYAVFIIHAYHGAMSGGSSVTATFSWIAFTGAL